VQDDIGEARVDVRARVVVNATGPWSDRVERLAGGRAEAAVRGSKGVHVSVPRERVGNVSAVTLTAPRDGRVMFVLPAGDHTIIGTTDTFDDVPPDEVRATSADVTYLLDAVNHYFPAAKLGHDDVVSAWAGLRPLAARGAAQSDPGIASREHSITQSAPRLIRVTGGKLTTYRAMAEEIVDVVERTLGRTPTPSETATRHLPGGTLRDLDEEIARAIAASGDDVVGRRLATAHGTAWEGIWSLLEADLRLGRLIDPSLPYMFAELLHATTHEQAATLGDLLIRRTQVAFETRDHGRAVARRVAPVVARWMHWTKAQTVEAIAAYDSESERIFGIDEV
jgi:glycerol-3-phosphate dehydrogenase